MRRQVVLLFMVGVLLMGLGVGTEGPFALLRQAESTLIAGGQGLPYPVGPGGPCANGISYICEPGEALCLETECTYLGGGVYECDKYPFYQKVRINLGWTVCNFQYPSGMWECNPFTWVCNRQTSCVEPCVIVIDDQTGIGIVVCDLAGMTVDADTHAGQKLEGGICP